jgi:hypothetical protein
MSLQYFRDQLSERIERTLSYYIQGNQSQGKPDWSRLAAIRMSAIELYARVKRCCSFSHSVPTAVSPTTELVTYQQGGQRISSPQGVIAPTDCGGWYVDTTSEYNQIKCHDVTVPSIPIQHSTTFSYDSQPFTTNICVPGELLNIDHALSDGTFPWAQPLDGTLVPWIPGFEAFLAFVQMLFIRYVYIELTVKSRVHSTNACGESEDIVLVNRWRVRQTLPTTTMKLEIWFRRHVLKQDVPDPIPQVDIVNEPSPGDDIYDFGDLPKPTTPELDDQPEKDTGCQKFESHATATPSTSAIRESSLIKEGWPTQALNAEPYNWRMSQLFADWPASKRLAPGIQNVVVSAPHNASKSFATGDGTYYQGLGMTYRTVSWEVWDPNCTDN